jgi:hypothetical protein
MLPLQQVVDGHRLDRDGIAGQSLHDPLGLDVEALKGLADQRLDDIVGQLPGLREHSGSVVFRSAARMAASASSARGKPRVRCRARASRCPGRSADPADRTDHELAARAPHRAT